MKNLLIVGSCIITLSGCSKAMIQLVHVSPLESDVYDNGTQYVFDNDTVSISYDFWDKEGKVDFRIENKLAVPIYIDWKKSNLIINNQPFPYWQDESNMLTVTKGASVGTGTVIGNVAIGGSNSNSVSNTKVTRQERISFIPPNSNILKESFRILEKGDLFKMEVGILPEVVQHDAKPKKTTSIYRDTHDVDDSPVKLTNFLTMSLTESFGNEIFMSHEFYLSEIQEMELKHFRGREMRKNEYGMPEAYYPKKLKSKKKFYMYVPVDMDYKKRWKKKTVILPRFLNGYQFN